MGSSNVQIQAGRFSQKLAGIVGLVITQLGSFRVAQLEGEGDEALRAGNAFLYSATGSTGQAPVQAIPTTTAQWLIYNPTANTVACMVDKIGMLLVSGTAGAGGAMFACPVTAANVPATTPTAVAASVNRNRSPISPATSQIVIATNQTLQGTAAADWFPIAEMNPLGTVLGQTFFETSEVPRGKFLIYPGTGLALCVISPTGSSPLFAPYVVGREYAQDVQ